METEWLELCGGVDGWVWIGIRVERGEEFDGVREWVAERL